VQLSRPLRREENGIGVPITLSRRWDPSYLIQVKRYPDKYPTVEMKPYSNYTKEELRQYEVVFEITKHTAKRKLFILTLFGWADNRLQPT